MSHWQTTSDEGGLPVWSGVDSIYDKAREGRGWAGFYGAGFLFSTILLVLSGWLLSKDSLTRGAGGFLSGVGWLTFLIAVVFFLYAYASSKFLSSNWTLRASDDHTFRYSGTNWGDQNAPPATWSIPIDSVARVESGPTREWMGARKYGFRVFEIPEYEHQTYLFLNDSRRLVIATINGGREPAGALAHSIRTWVEERNKSAALAARVGLGGAAARLGDAGRAADRAVGERHRPR